ncbi:MAG: SH3 domain-containing protein [Candidatus Cloacimonadales bacterium]|nr:tetratricopeptide repeat protein [Candidatus Cloacimonadota bacterium]MDD2651332.1 SH3 domain-containing protein [Candidatus Cloacimonadota bacterium]MDD3501426.1 SH3 domain-containing protein [Candidatus Cloacimonadota bacterium]MDX9976970.1 SH3 domain-containing protein [Candidatus Cloacimonadales bacterium]
MKNKIVLLILLILCFSFVYAESNAQELLNTANETYRANDFDKALALYSELDQLIPKNPDIFYNIGNCYFRLNRIGLAILYYKKTLLIDSSHSLAKKNLNFALKFTLDKQDFESQNFISSFLSRIYYSVSLNTIAWLCLIFFIVLIIIIHVFMQKNDSYEHTKKLLLIAIIILNVISISWGSARYYHFYHNNEAVITSSKVDAYSGPGESYTKLFTVHEGLILRVNKIEATWTQVSLANGFTGWIRTSTYKTVAL